MGQFVRRLQMHSIWKNGDENNLLAKDPLFCDLCAWYAAQITGNHSLAQDATVLGFARDIFLSLPLVQSVRGSLFLKSLKETPKFLLANAICLSQLYDGMVLDWHLYLDLRDYYFVASR